jgi:hypothetical protein
MQLRCMLIVSTFMTILTVHIQAADYLVHSFSDKDVKYTITTITITMDASRGGNYSAVTSCSCPAYANTQTKCKHMFLTSRITGLPLAPPPRTTNTGTSLIASATAPPVNALSAERVLAEKNALLERIAAKTAALPARIEALARVPVERISRDSLLAVEVATDRLRLDLNTTISGAALYAFNM